MVLLYLMGQSLTHLLVHAIFSAKDRRPFLRSGRLRRTLCLALRHPRVGRPFRARRLMSLHPGLKHLGYSVRPLRDHRKMSKLQAQGFNQVLTLGPHTKKANRPERAAGLELPDSLSRQSLGSGAVPCLSSTSRKEVNPFRKRF
jgi:hypothetical protein